MAKTKFDLKFPGEKSHIRCKIMISRSYDSKTGFCQGKDGRQIKTVKVLSNEDIKPTSKDDIEKVISYGEIESYFPYKMSDGTTKLLKIDTKVIKKLFENSSSMNIVGIVSMKKITGNMYDGSHYFVRVQRDTKTKTIAATDQKVYAIIYSGLLARNMCMLVKYISYNREKYAVIYADEKTEGLIMSHIFHSTYQRKEPKSQLVKIDNVNEYARKLFTSMKLDELEDSLITDTYEEKIKSFIDKLKDGKEKQGLKELKISKKITT